MGKLLVRLAIIFSVFVTGMHFPAQAAQSRMQGDVEAFTCMEHGDADKAEQGSSKPDDQTSEAAHHHHSPMAMGLPLKAAPGDLAPTPSLHFPVSPTALTSRNPVPPLDPPLA